MRILPPHDNPYYPYRLTAYCPEDFTEIYAIRENSPFAIGYCGLPGKEGWIFYIAQGPDGDLYPRDRLYPSFRAVRADILGYCYRHGLNEEGE